MKYLTVFFLLLVLALPAAAQNKIYRVYKIPGNKSVIVANPNVAQQSQCHVPQDLLGKSYHVLDTMKFPYPIRILGPEAVIPPDRNTYRMNFLLDSNGIIRDIRCG